MAENKKPAQLSIVYVSLDKLVPAEYNPRKITTTMERKMDNSLAESMSGSAELSTERIISNESTIYSVTCTRRE